MSTLLHDLRFALRLHLKRPLFTLIAVLCLALGIGVNVTVFGWIRSTLLNPLPGVPRSSELVCLDGRGVNGPNSLDDEEYQEIRRSAGVFRSSLGFDMLTLGMRFQERTETAWTQVVTGEFFETLEVRPALGRVLNASDCHHGKPLVAVLSHGYWVRRFGADPAILGQSVLLQGKPCTIVGVAQAGFHGALSGLRMDSFVPLEAYLDATKDHRATRTPNGANDVYARLKPGVSLKQASDRIRIISREMALRRTQGDKTWEALVLPLSENRHGLQSILRDPMFILGLAAAFLLLVACANVANLLLARGAERQGEFALRMALGGTKAKLGIQVLTEGLLLGAAGGLLGILAAWASQRLLLGFIPPTHFPILLEPKLDGGAVLFAVMLSLLTALLVSLLPALLSSDVKLATAMKEGGKGSQGTRHRRLMSTLIVVELMLATLLLTLTGHVIRGMNAIQKTPTGFQMRDHLVIGLDFGASDMPGAQRAQLVKDLVQRAQQLPGAGSAAMGFRVPFGLGGFWSSRVEPEGHTFDKGQAPKADWNVVSPGYFRTLRIPLLQGREFEDRDTADSESVAIVDERFVQRFWPGQDALGRRIKLIDAESSVVVVGVVKRISYEPLGSDRGFILYQPFAQSPMSEAALHVRCEGQPWALVPPLRAALAELAPTLPMGYVQDMTSLHRGAQFPLLILAQIMGFLGVVTLILAAVGTYGLIAHATARRTREFGIRLSMGATPGILYRLVVGQGARLAAIALLLGLAGGVALGQALKAVVAELGTVDPWVITGVSLVLASVTLLALSIPAWRASLTEPSKALRDE